MKDQAQQILDDLNPVLSKNPNVRSASVVETEDGMEVRIPIVGKAGDLMNNTGDPVDSLRGAGFSILTAPSTNLTKGVGLHASHPDLGDLVLRLDIVAQRDELRIWLSMLPNTGTDELFDAGMIRSPRMDAVGAALTECMDALVATAKVVHSIEKLHVQLRNTRPGG